MSNEIVLIVSLSLINLALGSMVIYMTMEYSRLVDQMIKEKSKK